MLYPSDFEPRVDAEEVLEYVLSNKEWFLERLGEENDGKYKVAMLKMAKYIDRYLSNEWEFLRKVRDGISNLTNEEVAKKSAKIYEDLEKISNYFHEYAKED